jgi:hypothetical protein
MVHVIQIAHIIKIALNAKEKVMEWFDTIFQD